MNIVLAELNFVLRCTKRFLFCFFELLDNVESNNFRDKF